MVLRSPESAQQLGFIMFLPLTFISNAFVPTQGMPGWLRAVADWSPFSALAAASRHLFGNPNPGRHRPRLADAAPRTRRPGLVRGAPAGVRPPSRPPLPPQVPRLSSPQISLSWRPVPAAPTITAITPTNGAAGGANDVKITGTGLGTATAIEIGTAAEFAAGTPATLNLCAASGPGCFTVVSSTSLDISSMPAHMAGAVTVKVVTLGIAASASYTYNAGPALLFPAPPGGEVGVTYSDQLTVTAGTSPFTWSVSSGSLPAGISLSPDGNLSGTPTATGTSSFTVKVTDAHGQSATQATSITVADGVSTTFAAPPAAAVNSAYSDTLTATGGTTPYTWSVNSGTLPAGLTLSSAGVLSGTPPPPPAATPSRST